MKEYDLDFEAMKSLTRLSWLLSFEAPAPADDPIQAPVYAVLTVV